MQNTTTNNNTERKKGKSLFWFFYNIIFQVRDFFFDFYLFFLGGCREAISDFS
eukprot:gene5428-3913_t